MKIAAIPKSGRVGLVIYSRTRFGLVARSFTKPRNPRTKEQQAHRENIRHVSRCWGALKLDQRAAWGQAAIDRERVSETGSRVGRSGYHFFVSLNTRRADLGLPLFELPPAQPSFNPNPAAELLITNTGGKVTLRVRISSTPATHTLVQASAPTRTGVRHVPHFPFLCLLPPPVDGWSDITEPYVARYGVPRFGQAVWLRTIQHIDGWTDEPKVTRARVSAPSL